MEDVFSSEELWKYLKLSDWLVVRSTNHRFRTLLDGETPFKGMARSMTIQGYVTGNASMKQQVMLESFIESNRRSSVDRNLFRGITSHVANFQVARKYAGGFAIHLWSVVKILEPLPAGLLSLLALRSDERVPEAASRSQVSADAVGVVQARLLHVPCEDLIYVDIANEQYVVNKSGNFMPFRLKWSYKITGETVTLSTDLHRQARLMNPHLISSLIWVDHDQ